MAFKHLSKARPVKTRRYTFDTIDLGAGPPVLEVRYGGKGTPGFRSDEIRMAAADQRRAGKLTERVFDEGLRDTAKLIAKHCVVSWQNVVEDDGSIAPCTPAKVEEFLVALIEDREDLFIDFSRFVRDPERFVDDATDAPAVSGVELGKP